MQPETTIIKSITPNENPFGGTTKKVNAFNSTKSLTDHSSETTREQRLRAEQRNADLAEQIKRKIRHEK